MRWEQTNKNDGRVNQRIYDKVIYSINDERVNERIYDKKSYIQQEGRFMFASLNIFKPLWHNDSPSQTSVTEVKHRPIEIVLGWGTDWVVHSVRNRQS